MPDQHFKCLKEGQCPHQKVTFYCIVCQSNGLCSFQSPCDIDEEIGLASVRLFELKKLKESMEQQK